MILPSSNHSFYHGPLSNSILGITTDLFPTKESTDVLTQVATEQETAKSFLTRLGTFSIGPIVGAAIGFFTVPITTRLVPPDVYGKLSMFTTATSLLSLLLLLGVDQAYVREYAGEESKGELWYTSLFLPLLLSLAVGAAVLVFEERIGILLFGTRSQLPVIGLALSLPVLIIHRFVLLAVRMAEAGTLYSAMEITLRLVSAVTTVLLVLAFGAGLSQILFPVILGPVTVVLLAVRSSNVPGLSGFVVQPERLRAQLKFGLPLVAASAMMWLLNSLDKIALRAWSSFAEVGMYAAAFRLAAILLVLNAAFTTFWAPTAYRWHEQGQGARWFQLVADSVALGLTIVYAFLMAARWLIVWLLGPEYRDAVHIIPLAALYPIMVTMSETTVMGIGFSRKTYWATIVTIIAAVTNVIGNVLLVPKHGAFGAALATALAFVVYFWARTFVSNRLWHGLRLGKIAAAFAVMAGNASLSVLCSNWRVDGIVALVAAMPVGWLLYNQLRPLRATAR